jgi:hypothetical protein
MSAVSSTVGFRLSGESQFFAPFLSPRTTKSCLSSSSLRYQTSRHTSSTSSQHLGKGRGIQYIRPPFPHLQAICQLERLPFTHTRVCQVFFGSVSGGGASTYQPMVLVTLSRHALLSLSWAVSQLLSVFASPVSAHPCMQVQTASVKCNISSRMTATTCSVSRSAGNISRTTR